METFDLIMPAGRAVVAGGGAAAATTLPAGRPLSFLLLTSRAGASNLSSAPPSWRPSNH